MQVTMSAQYKELALDPTASSPHKRHTQRLKLVLAAIATCCVVFLGLYHRYEVSVHHIPRATPLSTNLEYCPSHVPPAASPPAPINLWASLTPHETSQIQAWLESGAGGFNLTDARHGVVSDNTVYNIEVFYPPKNVSLAYLEDPQDARPPAREARVTIHHGGEEHPFVKDYVVGPLPVSEKTTIRPLSEIYHREEIPYNVRGLGDVAEAFGFVQNLLEPITDAMQDLFGGVFEGKENDTFLAGPSGPWSYDGSFRRVWVTWRYNTAGSYLLPINFYNYIDMSGTDVSQWKILRIVYHDQIFPSVASFLEAYHNGTLIRQPRPNLTPKDLEWSSRKRVGTPRDLDHLPGPRSVSFAGLRFRVDKERQYVSWMGWGLYLGFDRDMGTSLWDVRFRGERILYQLAPQEALAQYAGSDPIQSATAWLDRYFGMGTLVRNLIPNYDCPQEAVFLPAETFHANLGGHIRRDRAVCVFEQDTGKPLTRHAGDMRAEMGAVKGYTLTVRSIATVGNYDYLFDYVFHLDGTIEVKVSASGYLQGGYWTEKQRNYGYNLREHSMGTLHDHVINFKVDLDVAGTSNSFLKTTMAQEEVTLPWSDDDWGNTVIQQRITREYIDVEDDTRVDYARNFQGSFAVVNKDQTNKWGNPRGYVVHPGLSPVRNTVVGSKRMEKNANWAKYNLAATRRKETEPSSSCMWNLHLSGAPAVDFDKFFDGESIDQEDLVLWVNVGTHHLPQAEDSPNTKTNIATSGFTLTPLNYFDSDPSMESLNAIILDVPVSGDPRDAFTFDDNGVQQDFSCIPPAVPPFSYSGERPVFDGDARGNVLVKGNEVGAESVSATVSMAYRKLNSVLNPLRIRTGI